MEIPMNVEVICTNGVYGRSICVILDPKDKKVTHVVVREKMKPHTERIVPIRLVAGTSPTAIQLDCTTEGARVKAKDGFIGHVQKFLINPKDGRITHLILREGHLWGRKDREQTSAVLQPIDSCS